MSEGSRWQRRSRSSRDTDPSPTPTPKPPAPIILGARPAAIHPHPADHDSGTTQSLSGDVAGAASQSEGQHQRAGGDKPIVVLRSRDDNRNSSVSPGPTPGPAPGDAIPHSSHPHPAPHAPYPTQQQRHTSTSQQGVEPGKNRLAAPPEMKQSIKIIDENFRWVDAGIDDLVDQTDYLVVGAIGLQGSGKSTIVSMLAGNTAQDPYRNYVFQPQVKETREDAMFQTLGVDMFVSPERIIFLDTQPANSSSLLDYVIRQEKKYPQEYTSAENCIEMQSLQIASFLMTVCHVILVTQDWFTDLMFLRSLLTAEMLRPQTHSSNHEGSQSNSQDDSPEFHPTVVFVLNKAIQDDFAPETYTDMKLTLQNIFRSSKLRCQGAVNMHKDNVVSAMKAKEEGCDSDINLFLLPTMEYYKAEPESILTSLPEYRGFPSFGFLLRSLRNQVYSIPRMPMTPSPLSERNWFHFAARTWEAVKKSQLIAEYNRLLP
ncbi:nonsense-mediated mRNA decay factor SMG9-like [Littorina saxatilis]|uniref:Protein SMG9 n=1 Tax=Littorina saxatilis TaxID=31220 RepID=A0AAN9BPN8_9CAEN